MAGEPIIIPWATLANYPAGGSPWNAQPLKVAPAQFYFTPDVALPAENMNYELNAITAALAGAGQGVSLSAAANWFAPISSLDSSNQNGTVVTSATWDAYNEQWIAYCWDFNGGVTGAEVLSSYDGITWHIVTGLAASSDPTFFCVGVAVNPTNGQFVAVRTDGSTMVATVGNQTSGTTTTALAGNLASDATLIASRTGSGVILVGGHTAGGGAFTGVCLAYNGSAWSDLTSFLPAAWQSSTNTVAQFLSAQSSSGIAYAMCGVNPGVDTSRLMFETIAFTDVTPALLGGTALEIRGLAYDAVDQLWGILTQDTASPPNTKLWTTPDPITGGSTWTLAHTFAGHWAGGVACIGSVWCVLAQGITDNEFGNQIYFSGTVASLGASSTWSRSGYIDNQGINAASFPSEQMISSGSQVFRTRVYASPSLTTVSQKAGWQPSASNGI